MLNGVEVVAVDVGLRGELQGEIEIRLEFVGVEGEKWPFFRGVGAAGQEGRAMTNKEMTFRCVALAIS